MREITTHKVNCLNEAIKIVTNDAPDYGGACHAYCQQIMSSSGIELSRQLVLFHNGPIDECGPNGVSNESLLAIVLDRLECFQTGKFACEENRLALRHIESAMLALRSRTEKRMARGVEGTHAV